MHGKCSTGIAAVEINVHKMGASSSVLSRAGMTRASSAERASELFATLQPGVQFGITMTERPNDGAVAVKTVDAGSAAEAQGVRVGFLVREVGSKSCAGLQTVEVIDLFKTVRRPCRLKLSLVDYI